MWEGETITDTHILSMLATHTERYQVLLKKIQTFKSKFNAPIVSYCQLHDSILLFTVLIPVTMATDANAAEFAMGQQHLCCCDRRRNKAI